MLEKSKGIVLQTFKYGDSSLIAHIFTSGFGRKSFIFKGIRSKRSKQKLNLLQALSILNIDFNYKEQKDILIVRDFSRALALNDFPYNPVKSAQAILISEILHKSLQEEFKNSGLFEFLESFIEYFDLVQENYSNLHLSFLMKLTPYLGISPSVRVQSGKYYFDLLEGAFVREVPLHINYSDSELSEILLQFYLNPFSESAKIKLNRKSRNDILDIILRFYTIHNYKLDNLKSISVLNEVFDA